MITVSLLFVSCCHFGQSSIKDGYFMSRIAYVIHVFAITSRLQTILWNNVLTRVGQFLFLISCFFVVQELILNPSNQTFPEKNVRRVEVEHVCAMGHLIPRFNFLLFVIHWLLLLSFFLVLLVFLVLVKWHLRSFNWTIWFELNKLPDFVHNFWRL